MRCSQFVLGADEAGEHLKEDMASGHLQRTPPLTPPRRHRPRTNDVRVRSSHRFLPGSLSSTAAHSIEPPQQRLLKVILKASRKPASFPLCCPSSVSFKERRRGKTEQSQVISRYRAVLPTLLPVRITAKCQYSIFAHGPRLIKAMDAQRSGGGGGSSHTPLSFESVFTKTLKRHICAEASVKV